MHLQQRLLLLILVKEEENSYTLVVVHCHANITWLNEVPLDWRIVLYEKCQHESGSDTENVTQRSNLIRHQLDSPGVEECNGYLDFMHDYYYNLTTVTVFMHDDGLWPYSKWKGRDAHTPFATFGPIAKATRKFVTKEEPFLHFGVSDVEETWGQDPVNAPSMKILWPYFAIPIPNTTPLKFHLPSPPKHFVFKPSAHFAVRKELLQMRPQATYLALLQQLRFAKTVWDFNSQVDARQLCCAMERLWHIFFGLSSRLPKKATAMFRLQLSKKYIDSLPQTIQEG